MEEDVEFFQGKYHFNTKEISFYKDIFKFFDKTATDQITVPDLGLALRSAGALVTDQEVSQLVKKVDPYGSGYLEFNDFLLCFYQLSQKDKSDMAIRNSFRALDKDNSGFVNASELKHVLSSIGESLSDGEVLIFPLKNFPLMFFFP
jgi:calmodulin